MILYVIKNKEGLYATYGTKGFKENLNFARLYKSKKTALNNYHNVKNDYKDLTLCKLQIEVIEEELLNEKEFYNYK